MDIVSESVYRGLLRLHQLREPSHFNAWMDRITVHTALDHLRKKNHFKIIDDDILSQLPIDDTSLSVEENLDLYTALDFLSPEERTYVILRFFREYSFREMSEILELPESTIKSRLYRILKKLRQQLSS